MKKPYKRAYIEVSNICNLSCSFCPTLERAPAVMTTAFFDKVCEEVLPLTDHIYLHLMGEPLIHPQIHELLAIGRDKGLTLQLTTNGTLIGAHRDKLLENEAIRQVNISLSSFEANNQSQSLQAYLEPIIDFVLEAQKRKRPYISLRLWNLDSFSEKGQNALNHLFFKCLEEGLNLSFSVEEKMKASDSVAILPKVYLNGAEKFTWPNIINEPKQTSVYCYGLKDHFGILADGTVVPCCLDHSGVIALGNLHTERLNDILSSARALAMRKGFMARQAVEALCQTCGYAGRF